MAICIKTEPDAQMQKLTHSTVVKNLHESNTCGGVTLTSFWPGVRWPPSPTGSLRHVVRPPDCHISSLYISRAYMRLDRGTWHCAVNDGPCHVYAAAAAAAAARDTMTKLLALNTPQTNFVARLRSSDGAIALM